MNALLLLLLLSLTSQDPLSSTNPPLFLKLQSFRETKNTRLYLIVNRIENLWFYILVYTFCRWDTDLVSTSPRLYPDTRNGIYGIRKDWLC
jgi:hypothetical protein